MTEIALVRHSDNIHPLTELFRASFGHERSEKLWTWKYLQNPLSSDETEVVVAKENGNIIGVRPFMLAEMWLEDEKVKDVYLGAG